jgi:hypothetical protein
MRNERDGRHEAATPSLEDPSELELDGDGRAALPAFHEPGRALASRRPRQANPRVADAPIESVGAEAKRSGTRSTTILPSFMAMRPSLRLPVDMGMLAEPEGRTSRRAPLYWRQL